MKYNIERIKQMHFATKLLHDSFNKDTTTGSSLPPIYQATAFAYDSAEEMENVFAGRDAGFVYSRIANPSVSLLERRLASLENGVGAIACSSGMAAISNTVLALCSAGDEIVSAYSIFGGTYSLFKNVMQRFNIKVNFVDINNLDEIESRINKKTKMIFAETIGNPKLNVPDIAGLASIAKKHKICLVIDNTAASPFICSPATFGANIIIHSISKFINGYGTAIGGVIIDAGNFMWNNEKYPHLKPYYEKAGQMAFLASLRSGVARDIGACLAPFNAFLIWMTLDSLAVRMEKHSLNALAIAAELSKNGKVLSVTYPGLPQHPQHNLAKKQFNNNFGAILTVQLGSKDRAFRFINNLKLPLRLANIGDTKTLVIHPASTFCRELSHAERAANGVADDTVRISIGLEHLEDLLNDIEQSLNKL